MRKDRRRLRVGLPPAAMVVTAIALVAVATGSARSTVGPTLVAEPTIAGAAVVGEVLQGNRGLWSSSKDITYKYQWLQCKAQPADDSSSSTCDNITGATTTSYTVRSADLDRRIRFRVKATNSGGTTTGTSAPTSVVVNPGNKPAVSFPPVISGSAVVGQALTTSNGTWAGSKPLTFSYQWGRCDTLGNNCNSIGGATAKSYTLKQADLGKTLRSRVAAKNSAGKADAFSAPSDTVAPDQEIITLPDGSKSVDVKNVPKGERLIVDKVVFSPNPLTSTTQSFVAQIRVKDTRGYVVRGAIVFIRTTPRVADGGDNVPTSTDGWVQYSLPPTADMKKLTGFQNLQLFVKAYRKGDPELAGVSGTRLVQVGLDF
jgi:hypothetical protein